ncbi:unnamed protein product, partial [Chrysoparadoxa australica]
VGVGERAFKIAYPISRYLLAMTWQPELCFEQHDSFPGCLPGEKSLKPLTLHGLWPQNYDGTYPTACSNESFSFDDVLAAIPLKELEESWPNVKEDKRAAEYESFWEHEWSKHGTCTTLSQGMYFKTAVKMLEAVGTPDVMIWSGTGEAEREDIANFYGGDKMVLLECSHTYISQILLCFDKQEDDCVGDQIKCPEALLEKDNC